MDNTRLDPTRPASRCDPEPAQELRQLGEYRILRLLGVGGMGAVYLGYHEGLDRQVAIKILNEEMVSEQAHIDRFYREAKSGALLNHPNIVRTLNIGQDLATGTHYLILEFVDGPSVRELLDHCVTMSVGDAVHIVLDVARALEHAHSRNIVHRDIKPDNILTTRSGVAKLADLGLAKRTDDATHLTGMRQGFGTTHYMPYEQAVNARKADGRSDIYALGATLYHLLTGKLPFAGDSHLEVIQQKRQGHFIPAGAVNEAVPLILDQILAKMMACNQRDRYQTASELVMDLERSRLAARLPAFADAECARNDPWVQACLTATTPTRLDLETPPLIVQAPPPSDFWIVNFRNKSGKMSKVRATTAQIVKRLHKGSLPAGSELCREGESVFLPPSRLSEFQGALATRRISVATRRMQRQVKVAEVPKSARRRLVFVALAFLTLGMLAILLRS